MAGAVAATTLRVKVGTWVMSALHRNAGIIAKAAETLDEISDGRRRRDRGDVCRAEARQACRARPERTGGVHVRCSFRGLGRHNGLAAPVR